MSEPLLVKAVLQTYTGDNDRDHDSCLNVLVRTADEKTMIAKMELGLCSGEYGYGQHEPHTDEIPLCPGADKLTKSQCQQFQFCMGITPTGHDEWNFDAWLILYFDDGSWDWNDKLSQDINENNIWHKKLPLHQCGWYYSHAKPPFAPLEGLSRTKSA